MAAGEVTGWTHQEVAEASVEHKHTPLYENHDIPFERAYCLAKIGKQPEEYDGGQRFCSKRASKLKDDEWAERYDEPYQQFDIRAYCHTCRFHGRRIDGHPETLKPYTASITHGIYAEDKNLRMDFTDDEQALYDGIMEQWPTIYDWPSRNEDPARYLILQKVATNTVRTVRAEDYIDEEGEVRISDKYNDDGIVIEPDGLHEENPIAGEYRLLWREITNNLKELGLTPKEQASQGAQKQTANALDAIGDAINDAIIGGDANYDPDRFEDHDDETENAA